MPSPALTYPLPDPCEVCGGVVTYTGKGRRPAFCSPACRRADRTAYERARARRAQRRGSLPPEWEALESRTLAAAEAARPHVAVWRTATDWMPEADELVAATRSEGVSWRDSFTVESLDGAESWRQRSRRRINDPAARWLADNHPEALDDWPPDV